MLTEREYDIQSTCYVCDLDNITQILYAKELLRGITLINKQKEKACFEQRLIKTHL